MKSNKSYCNNSVPTVRSAFTRLIFLFFFFSLTSIQAQEWRKFYESVNLDRYRPENEKLGPPTNDESRVVLMGNSITEIWPISRPDFFERTGYIGRGISGHTTPQMLIRYRTDVISLQPKVVAILAGINDIAQNTGYTPIEIIADNVMTMAELAKQHGIEVVICSVLPAIDFPWKPGLEPASKVVELNGLLEAYASENDVIYVDYHTAMKDEEGGLRVPELTSSNDLVHPNAAGYEIMESMLEKAVNQALLKSQVTLSALFADHMVLQQKENVSIWGTAPVGMEIKAQASWGSEGTAISNTDGKWILELETPEAGGPFDILIASKSNNIKLKDVLVGEVWLASGQSNMSMPLKGWPPNDPIINAEEEIGNANYPNIRMFKVANNFSLKKENNVTGSWEVSSPESAGEFSASAYFFAKRLTQELNIPIGIIHSSWGGTPAESWVSSGKLKEIKDFDSLLESLENPDREKLATEWYARWGKTPYPEKIEGWNTIDLKDKDLTLPEYDDSKWETMTLPGRVDWHNEQDVNGAFWFRRTFEINDPSIAYTFEMGVVDDVDVVYVNAQRIGGTTYNFTDGRSYPIANSILKKGTNSIAIRVIDTGGPGSISGVLKLSDQKNESISLDGDWKFRITSELYNDHVYNYDLEELDGLVRPNIVTTNAFTPTTLFNAMIHPLLPYNIKGVVWYQGESNVGRAEQYERLFAALIDDWRTKWNKNIPFYFVQIAPFQYSGEQADQSQYLRDAQRRTLTTPNTGMVVTLDIGNYTNIHPSNKQDIGGRLAGLALANDYGKAIVSSGPLYRNSLVKKRKIIIAFDHVGSGLLAKEGTLTGFEIAGADQNFVPAEAEIKGDVIVVSAVSVSAPAFVRYAWSDKGVGNLSNKEGLPASSFTTEK